MSECNEVNEASPANKVSDVERVVMCDAYRVMRMNYEEFKYKKDIELCKRRHEILKQGNREYNKGLAIELGFFGIIHYPNLRRSDT